MNKVILVAIAGLLIVSVPVLSNTITLVHAQKPVFAPAMNLSKTGQSNDAQIATSGKNVYVVWVGDHSENGEIFFTRSTDGGITFSDSINISNASGLSTEPELAVYGNNVYVIWQDETLGRANIFFVRSTGAGATFTEPVNLSKEIVTSGVAHVLYHQIVTSGNNVYVIWSVQAGESSQIFFVKSTDRGESFSTPMNVSKNKEGYAGVPQITVAGDNIYIAWHKGDVVPGERIYPDIYFTSSKNGGLTFSAPIILTGNDAINTIPQVALSAGNIYLAWYHSNYSNDGTSNSSIFFARSTDEGVSFGNITKIAENPELELGIPRMAVSGDNIYVVWRFVDEDNNVYAVFFARSNDGGITFSEPINLNNIARGFPMFDTGSMPAIAASGSNVYVVWSDITSEGNYETFLVASTDQGASFSAPVNLSNNAENSSPDPQIAVLGNNVYVVWTDSIPKGMDILFSKASIQNSVSETPKTDAPWKIYKVELDDQTFRIPYRITDSNLRAIEVDPDFLSLIITIVSDPDKDGTLELVIPRNLIDPGYTEDEDFIVLADSKETEIEEINKSSCFRTILISFPAGSKQIEIIGTTMLGPGTVGVRKPEAPPVYITTDKNDYKYGDVITLSGCTNLALDDVAVAIQVLNPEREVYKTLTLDPNIDGSFETLLVVKGSLAINGTYTVKASYAGQSTTNVFVVPEFPVNLMVLTAVGLIGVLVAMRVEGRHSGKTKPEVIYFSSKQRIHL